MDTPGYANIDRHGLHVEAVLGHAVSVGAEVFIAPGRAVAAYDIDLGVGTPQRHGQIMQKIEDARIVVVNIAGAVVAQILIQPRQGIGIVGIPVPVHDVEPFPGVGVKEVQAIGNLKGRCIIRHGPRSRAVETRLPARKTKYKTLRTKTRNLKLQTKIGPPEGGPLIDSIRRLVARFSRPRWRVNAEFIIDCELPILWWPGYRSCRRTSAQRPGSDAAEK